jgi:hypothetical protein
MTKTIKPSDVKKWDVVKHDPAKHSRATKEIKYPEWYSYYKDDKGFYFPHRTPTIREILENKFF